MNLSDVIQFSITVACGSAMVIGGAANDGAKAWTSTILGCAVVLWPIIGVNVAAWIQAKHQPSEAIEE